MRVGVLNEGNSVSAAQAGVHSDGVERRVAITPDSIKRLAQKRIEVVVERGAGTGAMATDEDYAREGASLAARSDVLATADIVLRVRPPTLDEVGQLRPSVALVAPLAPLVRHDLVRALAERRVTALALDAIPRTTVAQMMDVLSSQATVAGYHAVLLAAEALPRFFPMLITAAGTIAPATVLVLGAGVAGLSAIGTAKRLGARVEAFDVRKIAKEQVESLGAKFVEVDSDEDAQAAGGYAREVSEAYKTKQAALLGDHVARADVVVCTALVPGHRAPILVTRNMVRRMKPGSVVVDLAAEQGGNCEATEPGNRVEASGVTVIGHLDVPSRVAVHASQMWSRNMEKFLFHISKEGVLRLDEEDEIVRGCLVVRDGEIVHDKVREQLGLGREPKPSSKGAVATEAGGAP